jgi:Flp pilus assembly protein TadB
MSGRRGERPQHGALWLALVPAACCGGPLLIAGLAAAGALAWGGLGLGLTAVLAGALLIIWRRRRAGRARRYPR